MVTLAVEDWDETVAFYHERLGLELLQRDEPTKRARLRAGPELVLEIHAGGWGARSARRPAGTRSRSACGSRTSPAPCTRWRTAGRGCRARSPGAWRPSSTRRAIASTCTARTTCPGCRM